MKTKIPSFRLYYDRELIAEIPLSSPEFVIGRQPGCHLRLLESSVSREHCRITLEPDGSLIVEDLSSTNGTLVNSRRVVRHSLHPNDLIALGRCTLSFHDLEPAVLERSLGPSWARWLGSSPRPKYTEPRGAYVLPKDNLVTQFDAISYGMVRNQAQTDGSKKTPEAYLKRLPRLRVVADGDAGKEEVTRFSVSKEIFSDSDLPPLGKRTSSLPVFAQPEVKGGWLRIPWKAVERITIPLVLVVALVFVGRYFLTFHIDTQLKQADEFWDQKLTAVGDRLRYADDRTLASPNLPELGNVTKSRETPLSITELWRRIDAQPSLRDFLLFQVLDEVLAEEDISWSIDEALKNLSRIRSVTTRLPSVKKLKLVLVAEASPFDMRGVRQGQVLFLSRKEVSKTLTEKYSEYKEAMNPRLAAVSKCAGTRKSISAGKVVLAFTVGSTGRLTSVFVNEGRSTKEPALWNCVKKTLTSLTLPPPPGGQLSIVYAFQFAAPTKIEF